MAMRVALSVKIKERSICVVQSLDWPGVKTKELAARLGELAWNEKVLFVCGGWMGKGLLRSSSNLDQVEVIRAKDLHAYDVVVHKRVVLDMQAVRWLERNYQKDNAPLRVMPVLPLLADKPSVAEVSVSA